MTLRLRLVAVLVGLTTLVVACGVPEDPGPESFALEEVPDELLAPPSTIDPAEANTTAAMWFLAAPDNPEDPVHLEPVDRPVESRDVEDVVRGLLTAGGADLPTGLSSSIPPDTELLSVPSTSEGVVVIDLSAEFFESIEGERNIEAIAQIVFTVTEFSPTITRVQFLQEGAPVSVSDQDGVVQESPVSRTDYLSLAPEPFDNDG